VLSTSFLAVSAFFFLVFSTSVLVFRPFTLLALVAIPIRASLLPQKNESEALAVLLSWRAFSYTYTPPKVGTFFRARKHSLQKFRL
jgi:hypothetical protein